MAKKKAEKKKAEKKRPVKKPAKMRAKPSSAGKGEREILSRIDAYNPDSDDWDPYWKAAPPYEVPKKPSKTFMQSMTRLLERCPCDAEHQHLWDWYASLPGYEAYLVESLERQPSLNAVTVAMWIVRDAADEEDAPRLKRWLKILRRCVDKKDTDREVCGRIIEEVNDATSAGWEWKETPKRGGRSTSLTCDELAGLLNCREDDPALDETLERLGARPPAKRHRDIGMSFLVYNEHRIELAFSGDESRLGGVILKTPLSLGHSQSYAGEVPGGVSVEDGRNEVRQKLGKPFQSSEKPSRRDSYEFGRALLTFQFRRGLSDHIDQHGAPSREEAAQEIVGAVARANVACSIQRSIVAVLWTCDTIRHSE